MELRLWELREACGSLIMPEPNKARLWNKKKKEKRERERESAKITTSGNEEIFRICPLHSAYKIVTNFDKRTRIFFASCICNIAIHFEMPFWWVFLLAGRLWATPFENHLRLGLSSIWHVVDGFLLLSEFPDTNADSYHPFHSTGSLSEMVTITRLPTVSSPYRLLELNY